MATNIEYRLVGKLNLITNNLTSDVNVDGFAKELDKMETAAFGTNKSSYKKVTENMQYVDGLYNTTIAYYEELQQVTT